MGEVPTGSSREGIDDRHFRDVDFVRRRIGGWQGRIKESCHLGGRRRRRGGRSSQWFGHVCSDGFHCYRKVRNRSCQRRGSGGRRGVGFGADRSDRNAGGHLGRGQVAGSGSVNRGHPLLSAALSEQDVHAYNREWRTDDHEGHGTEMAGLALYGDLLEALLSREPVEPLRSTFNLIVPR
ncbi:MAG: S8 family serine peptidase [Myxococcaceae bacterium]